MGKDKSDDKPLVRNFPEKLAALLGAGVAILNGALVVNSAADIKSAVENGMTDNYQICSNDEHFRRS